MGSKKYDPNKTYGEEWADKTMTGRAAKAAMQMFGVNPDEQRSNWKMKVDREPATGRFRRREY